MAEPVNRRQSQRLAEQATAIPNEGKSPTFEDIVALLTLHTHRSIAYAAIRGSAQGAVHAIRRHETN